MSATMYWRPTQAGRKPLDDQLRFILEQEFGRGRVQIGSGHVAWLRGLVAAGVKGAQVLIDAIEKCGTIEIWEEC